MDDALRSFDGVLAEKPTNVIALLGKVRTNVTLSYSIQNLDRLEFSTPGGNINRRLGYFKRS